jgi:hypothetical protein
MSAEKVPALRVSDAEREQAVADLARQFAAGRLDAHDLGERTEAAYRARTREELDTVAHDLPAAFTPWIRLREHVVAFVLVNALLIGTWLATRDPTPSDTDAGAGYYWPFWVAAIWAVVLAGHAFVTRRTSRRELGPGH